MSASEARISLCGRLGLKPLTSDNILYYYAPIQGVASYTALAINVMNPSLVARAFPKRDITNILLFNTLLGSGLYIYNKPHVKSLSKTEKIIYSAFGALTFSLGSVLMWAIIRNILPQNVCLCTAIGVGSGAALVKIGRNYVGHVDRLVKATE